MSIRVRTMTLIGAVFAVAAIMLPTAALAHEKRVVGKYTFVVGFLNEPAIQGEPNALDLTISDANGKPVLGAEKTLKVGIGFSGGTPKDLPLTARFGLPGKYTANVIPTKVGTYEFVFSGTLNGDPVTQTFESGPGTFDDVNSAQSLEFPVAVPATADLAQQTQSANDTAQAALQRATLFGIGGVVVGLIGIVLAIVALLVRTRPTSVIPEAEAGSTTVAAPMSGGARPTNP